MLHEIDKGIQIGQTLVVKVGTCLSVHFNQIYRKCWPNGPKNRRLHFDWGSFDGPKSIGFTFILNIRCFQGLVLHLPTFANELDDNFFKCVSMNVPNCYPTLTMGFKKLAVSEGKQVPYPAPRYTQPQLLSGFFQHCNPLIYPNELQKDLNTFTTWL